MGCCNCRAAPLDDENEGAVSKKTGSEHTSDPGGVIDDETPVCTDPRGEQPVYEIEI